MAQVILSEVNLESSFQAKHLNSETTLTCRVSFLEFFPIFFTNSGYRRCSFFCYLVRVACVFTFPPRTNQDESLCIISVGVILFSPCIMFAWFCFYVCTRKHKVLYVLLWVSWWGRRMEHSAIFWVTAQLLIPERCTAFKSRYLCQFLPPHQIWSHIV